MQRTPPPTRTTSPTSSRGTTDAPKKNQPAGKAEKHLPRCISDITSKDSFRDVIHALVGTINNAVTDGKSVTTSNKNLILKAAAEIQAATAKYFSDIHLKETKHDSITSCPDCYQHIVADITNNMKEEIANLRSEIKADNEAATKRITTTYASIASRHTQFGHTKKNCKNPSKRCANCAEEGHLHTDCKTVDKSSKCYNCTAHNDDITLEQHTPPHRLLHPTHRVTFTPKHFHSELQLYEYLSSLPHPTSTIFTDGSKLDDDSVGAAFVCYDGERPPVIKKFKLHNSCSVFQAELFAILQASGWASQHKYLHTLVLSDSRSTIQASQNRSNTHPLVALIHKTLHLHTTTGYIDFAWIKSHAGLAGNETADTAAKRRQRYIELRITLCSPSATSNVGPGSRASLSGETDTRGRKSMSVLSRLMSSRGTTDAPKKNQLAGKADKRLPRYTLDVTSQDSFQDAIRALVETINNLIKEEKSVTVPNKNLILNAAAEIQDATTKYFRDTHPKENSQAPPKIQNTKTREVQTEPEGQSAPLGFNPTGLQPTEAAKTADAPDMMGEIKGSRASKKN
ncbi:unnamed protein product [Euphydryas editha]|uniref:CCHC-type domain-containing protein n=1 Tax=Euphydryas editha TaxID=104508 RepID=A0AAU9TPF7_EUPED|nr:unnamed protein product [Euphydryas editha]